MSDEPDHTRRWLINAGGAAIMSSAVPITGSHAQTAAAAPPNAPAESSGDLATDSTPISPVTTALAEYVSKTLDRELPTAVAARTKLHVLDTIAAMISGARLKPGEMAIRFARAQGGTAEASIVTTNIRTAVINAALVNAMFAHADETDDFEPVTKAHPGCSAVPAALAVGDGFVHDDGSVRPHHCKRGQHLPA